MTLPNKGKAQGLSHGSFWAYSGEEEEYNPPNEVPEPSAAAALGLLAAGMLGMKKKGIDTPRSKETGILGSLRLLA
ncbi:PEP-CTERM sorting domain-containing protein [Roseofilum sp. BLCC_M91]|uniref:PEP-CTERM sorting domain-containing protein n=1 Tax=Roseofilum halophilum BLCC-M91 TaxID=3022259 RepID=A0ABT7BP71_9CYAN|nr:PEP-CTERM sorting domain-containing protein [Roseofilum halophilum]MDJ1180334.1 PEP-CTERM sorting domain-containing protein [Roseofilum halophilum BLCC-M91]